MSLLISRAKFLQAFGDSSIETDATPDQGVAANANPTEKDFKMNTDTKPRSGLAKEFDKAIADIEGKSRFGAQENHGPKQAEPPKNVTGLSIALDAAIAAMQTSTLNDDANASGLHKLISAHISQTGRA
jgi:hypothetical protein